MFTEAKPPEAYWSEDMEFAVNVTLVAGDNLINAIYNDRDVYEIYFYNVTYTLKPTELYPTGIKTTTPEELHPVEGVGNSQGGKYLYQDAREDDQVKFSNTLVRLICMVVFHSQLLKKTCLMVSSLREYIL